MSEDADNSSPERMLRHRHRNWAVQDSSSGEQGSADSEHHSGIDDGSGSEEVDSDNMPFEIQRSNNDDREDEESSCSQAHGSESDDCDEDGEDDDERCGDSMFDLEAEESSENGQSSNNDAECTSVKFAPFMRLPVEIRNMIWEAYCPSIWLANNQPQIYTLVIASKGRVIEAGPYLAQQTEPSRVVLAVHQASRDLGIKAFPDNLKFDRGSAVLRFCAERDVIFFQAGLIDKNHLRRTLRQMDTHILYLGVNRHFTAYEMGRCLAKGGIDWPLRQILVRARDDEEIRPGIAGSALLKCIWSNKQPTTIDDAQQVADGEEIQADSPSHSGLQSGHEDATCFGGFDLSKVHRYTLPFSEINEYGEETTVNISWHWPNTTVAGDYWANVRHQSKCLLKSYHDIYQEDDSWINEVDIWPLVEDVDGDPDLLRSENDVTDDDEDFASSLMSPELPDDEGNETDEDDDLGGFIVSDDDLDQAGSSLQNPFNIDVDSGDDGPAVHHDHYAGFSTPESISGNEANVASQCRESSDEDDAPSGPSRRRKRPAILLDSDEDEEEVPSKKRKRQRQITSLDSDEDQQEHVSSKGQKRQILLFTSDDEEEDAAPTMTKRQRRRLPRDDEDDDSDRGGNNSKAVALSRKNAMFTGRSVRVPDDDFDADDPEFAEASRFRSKRLLGSVNDSSSDDNEEADGPGTKPLSFLERLRQEADSNPIQISDTDREDEDDDEYASEAGPFAGRGADNGDAGDYGYEDPDAFQDDDESVGTDGDRSFDAGREYDGEEMENEDESR